MKRSSFLPHVRRAIAVASIGFLGICALPASADTILHDFTGSPSDGYQPVGSLVYDSNGNLYGTTSQGGANLGNGNGEGTVFVECRPAAPGPFPCHAGLTVWTYFVLYSFKGFTSGSQDGYSPQGTLLPLSTPKGFTLYGTTVYGGARGTCGNSGCGTVFKLTCPTNCTSWTYTIPFKFRGGTTDGAYPYAGVIEISDGTGLHLAGATTRGGSGCGSACGGTVFVLNEVGKVPWTETVLHTFTGAPDGADPIAPLTENNGYLYGTTAYGGSGTYGSYGSVFKVEIAGSHLEQVLYSFCSVAACADGQVPLAGVIFDPTGDLFGTTYTGGASGPPPGWGTVFELPTTGGETVLHSFCSVSNCPDGQYPAWAGLTFDTSGNLYGTTTKGGTPGCNCGIAFELPYPTYTSTNPAIYSFLGGTADGANPSAGVTFDTPWTGNASGAPIYGTTLYGGPGKYGDGVIFSYP